MCQRAKAKRDVANLEKRWLIADAKVAERRQADAEAASESRTDLFTMGGR